MIELIYHPYRDLMHLENKFFRKALNLIEALPIELARESRRTAILETCSLYDVSFIIQSIQSIRSRPGWKCTEMYSMIQHIDLARFCEVQHDICISFVLGDVVVPPWKLSA